MYALLPNKQRNTYERLFHFVKNLVVNTHPHSIYCNFEMAALNAIRECFPEVALKGCFFHLAQNMSLVRTGTANDFNNDVHFAMKAKMVVVWHLYLSPTWKNTFCIRTIPSRRAAACSELA